MISCLGGRIARVEEQILKLISDKEETKRTVREMQKVVLMESETISGKVVPNLHSLIELGYYTSPSVLRLTVIGNFQAIVRIKAKTLQGY